MAESEERELLYPIVAQTPEYKVDTLSGLENIPVTGASPTAGLQVLGGLGKISREQSPAVVSHYNIQPVIDLFATTQDRDLGGAAHDIQALIKATAKDAPRGATVTLRGQVATMNTAFSGLGFGLLGAVVLIYLLIVVNFQSWLDPFVIITALPAALAGIVWMLFATHTTLSVPALTGAIMCMGVATANSVLVVSFARERLDATGDAMVAAIEAGFTRCRPVLMTALAMIIGMAPMALGLGEGGEQNAPLGRAVIGGLIFATIATLMFVPVVFSIVHGRKAAQTSGACVPPVAPKPERPMPDLPGNPAAHPAQAPEDGWRHRRLRVAVGVVALGVIDRVYADPEADQLDFSARAIPTVNLVSLSGGVGPQALVLPGDVQAFNTAPIHAAGLGPF